MVGRAGRAGMGNIGESILICKNNELQKITELLKSKMDDSLSTLHIDKDRGYIFLSYNYRNKKKTNNKAYK